jgi:hypothetical protein
MEATVIPFELLPQVALVGVGAAGLMDLGLWLQRRLDFGPIGRWVGHMAQGRFAHESIAKAPPVRGEKAIGWAVHYATGIAFAALLVALAGPGWLAAPSLGPALAVGIGTVAAPLFVLQPAMGAGVASRKTATPWRNRLRSLLNHAVFGAGLYLAALALRWALR